jgi:hypothetical protein
MRIFEITLLVLCIAGACGGKAIVDGPPGSGGAGGASSASATKASTGNTVTTGPVMTTGPMPSTGTVMPCADPPGCLHCSACTSGCGKPGQLNKTLCKCNKGPGGMSSEQLYAAYYGCFCGADGMGGNCGGKCAKTCNGIGQDAPDCMSCIGQAVGTVCGSDFKNCNADK